MSAAPVRLVQFTDLHLFGSPAARLREVATLASFEATLAAARARVAPWSALLLTGDLVQDDPGGYSHLVRLLGDEPGPVLCLPGNHDDPSGLRRSLGRAPFRIGGHAVFGAWLVVMLDSVVPGAEGGRLGDAELARLEATLHDHAGQPALVCLHHPPVPLHSRWLDAIGLANAEALFAVIDRHPQVRALAWGHAHQAFEDRRHDVRLFGTPATSAQFRARSDAFATDDLPPAFRWFDLHADGHLDTGVCWLGAVAV